MQNSRKFMEIYRVNLENNLYKTWKFSEYCKKISLRIHFNLHLIDIESRRFKASKALSLFKTLPNPAK